jgi:acetyl esterase/lipase
LPVDEVRMMRRCFHILPGVFLLIATAAFAAEPEPAAPKQFTYSVANGDSLAAFVFTPEARGTEPPNAILLFHGGGWVAGSPEWVFASAKRFAQWGLVAIAIEYRLSGENVTPIDALADVCAAFAWTRAHAAELGISKNVAGYGVSAGGHLLGLYGTGRCKSAERPAAMLFVSPALDVSTDRWFEKLLKERAPVRDYSPVEHVDRTTPPTSIAHGAEDTLTPLAGVQRFHDRMVAAGGTCELNVYPGVGHLFTRNLANQEDDFDPDPEKRADANEKHRRFLMKLGLISGK